VPAAAAAIADWAAAANKSLVGKFYNQVFFPRSG